MGAQSDKTSEGKDGARSGNTLFKVQAKIGNGGAILTSESRDGGHGRTIFRSECKNRPQSDDLHIRVQRWGHLRTTVKQKCKNGSTVGQ